MPSFSEITTSFANLSIIFCQQLAPCFSLNKMFMLNGKSNRYNSTFTESF